MISYDIHMITIYTILCTTIYIAQKKWVYDKTYDINILAYLCQTKHIQTQETQDSNMLEHVKPVMFQNKSLCQLHNVKRRTSLGSQGHKLS